MKIGLEVEFFVFKKGKPIAPFRISGGIPTDGYALLVEARGKPSECPYAAVASVRGEIDRLVSLIREGGAQPKFINWLPRDADMKKAHLEVLRQGSSSKKRISWENMHGHPVSEKNDTHVAAGLHISFTDELVRSYTDESKIARKFTCNQMFDVIKIFRNLELEFEDDINDAERVCGFYELKPDGRIEYRSLPATLIHTKDFARRLARVLDEEVVTQDDESNSSDGDADSSV